MNKNFKQRYSENELWSEYSYHTFVMQQTVPTFYLMYYFFIKINHTWVLFLSLDNHHKVSLFCCFLLLFFSCCSRLVTQIYQMLSQLPFRHCFNHIQLLSINPFPFCIPNKTKQKHQKQSPVFSFSILVIKSLINHVMWGRILTDFHFLCLNLSIKI